MFQKHVYYSTNAFGKPIEVFAVETRSHLCMTVKLASNVAIARNPDGLSRDNEARSKVHESSDETSSDDDDRPSNGSMFNSEPLDPMDTDDARYYLDMINKLANPDQSHLLSRPYQYAHMYKTSMYTLSACIIALLLHSLAFDIGSNDYQIAKLMIAITLIALLTHVYHKSYHEVIEETVLVIKNKKHIMLSSKRNRARNAPSVTSEQTLNNGYFVHQKKYRIAAPQKRLLPLRNLIICELLRSGRILHSLVVQSNEQIKASTMIPGSPSLDCSHYANSECDNRNTSDEVVLFSSYNPKMECIEYIMQRIQNFLAYS